MCHQGSIRGKTMVRTIEKSTSEAITVDTCSQNHLVVCNNKLDEQLTVALVYDIYSATSCVQNVTTSRMTDTSLYTKRKEKAITQVIVREKERERRSMIADINIDTLYATLNIK